MNGAKQLLCVVVAFLACSAFGSEAIILLRHDRAGPNLPTQDFIHPDWMLWPAEDRPGSENGLLSILSGSDWQGQSEDLQFEPVARDLWRSSNFESLVRRGYMQEVQRKLGSAKPILLANPRSAVGREELLFGVGTASPDLKTRPYDERTRYGGLVIYEALSWHDAAQVARSSGDRALVIEYPPLPGTNWSRFWRYGKSWPAESLDPVLPGIEVPGLCPLREALDLLRTPNNFRWVTNTTSRWGGPNRWLIHGETESPIVMGVCFGSAALAVLAGLLFIGSEHRSVAVRALCQAVLLFPAADLLAGNVSASVGLSSWAVFLPFFELVLLGSALLVTTTVRSRAPEVNFLFGVCLVGAGVSTVCLPLWSDFSNVFRWPVDLVSPEMAAAWIGYLTGLFAFARDLHPKSIWIGRALTLALVVWTAAGDPWWVNGTTSFAILPVVPMVAAEGLLGKPFIFYTALLPTSLWGLRRGFAWEPYRVLTTSADIGAFNSAEWARFLVSPGFIATLFVGGVLLVLASGFASHQMKLVVRTDARRVAPLWAAIGLTALGILHPEMLYGALVLGIGGVLVVVHEGLE